MSKDNIGEFEMSIPGMKRSFVNGRHGRTTVVNLDAVKSLAKQADACIAEQQREIEELKSTLLSVIQQLTSDPKVFSHERFDAAMLKAHKLLGENNG